MALDYSISFWPVVACDQHATVSKGLSVPDKVPIRSLCRRRRHLGFGPPVLQGTTGQFRVEFMQAFLTGGAFGFAVGTTTFVIATVDEDGESVH